MRQFFKKLIANETILAVVMIALTVAITHGLMIPRLGYYHDDWYMLWSGASRGADSLISLFSMDRPFMGVIYSRFYHFIRDSIPGWHLFALILRIAGGLVFYWILNLAWQGRKKLFVLAAMLFVVFPGFLAEPNAATKVNHLIGYGSALLSIALTLQSVKTSHRNWKYLCIILSMLLMAFYLWIYEYMIGLEVMRVVLLYWMQRQDRHEKAFTAARNILLAYIPYLLVMALFVFWRVLIFESTRPATDLKGLVTDYQGNFATMALRLVTQVIKDFFSASTFAWSLQAYHLVTRAELGAIITAALTASGVVLLTIGYLRFSRKSENAVGQDVSPFAFILIGSLIILGAIFPVILSNRRIDLLDAYKGYALHPSAGVMILVIGIISMVREKFRNLVLIALLGFSVATQSLNIQKWADYWDVQREFWWQLTWRAPEIRDNTLVMAYLPEGYVFQQDYEIWGPVNLIYRPFPLSVPRIQSEVLNQGTVLDILEGRYTDPYVRDIFLPRDFQKLLLISQPTTSSCIHVIDGAMPAYSANERLIVEKVGGFSKVDFIDTAGAAPAPPTAIFGREPEHGWCYYYQQASLARQSGDWVRIGELYEAAVSSGLEPADTSEYFVFIEGLTNLGRTGEAKKIAKNSIKENDAVRYSLCKSLDDAPAYPASYGYRLEQINQIVCK